MIISDDYHLDITLLYVMCVSFVQRLKVIIFVRNPPLLQNLSSENLVKLQSENAAR